MTAVQETSSSLVGGEVMSCEHQGDLYDTPAGETHAADQLAVLADDTGIALGGIDTFRLASNPGATCYNGGFDEFPLNVIPGVD